MLSPHPPLDGSTWRGNFDWHLDSQNKHIGVKSKQSSMIGCKQYRKHKCFSVYLGTLGDLSVLDRSPGCSGAVQAQQQATQTRAGCLSQPPACSGRVFDCVKSLGISPSSLKAFQAHEAISHNPCRGRREMQANYQNKIVQGWQRRPLQVSICSYFCLLFAWFRHCNNSPVKPSSQGPVKPGVTKCTINNFLKWNGVLFSHE